MKDLEVIYQERSDKLNQMENFQDLGYQTAEDYEEQADYMNKSHMLTIVIATRLNRKKTASDNEPYLGMNVGMLVPDYFGDRAGIVGDRRAPMFEVDRDEYLKNHPWGQLRDYETNPQYDFYLSLKRPQWAEDGYMRRLRRNNKLSRGNTAMLFRMARRLPPLSIRRRMNPMVGDKVTQLFLEILQQVVLRNKDKLRDTA